MRVPCRLAVVVLEDDSGFLFSVRHVFFEEVPRVFHGFVGFEFLDLAANCDAPEIYHGRFIVIVRLGLCCTR